MIQFHFRSPEILLLLFLLLMNMFFSSGENHNPCVRRGDTWECTNLNYIPDLPANTTKLLLVNFNVNNLSRETFSNLTGLPLQVLELRRPQYNYVTDDVFTDMIHLRTLIIKSITSKVYPKTRKRLRGLFLSLHSTNITALHLYKVYLRSLPYNLFKGLRNTSLRSLRLRNCHIRLFNGTSISYLTKLYRLDLSSNTNLEIIDWGHLPVLTYLNLNNTSIEQLLKFGDKSLAYPELQTLILSLSSDHHLNGHNFEGLLKLTALKIQAEDELFMDSGTIGTILPKLKSLSITGAPGARVVQFKPDEKAIVSSSLYRLEMKNVYLKPYNLSFICHNLTDLILSRFEVENTQQLVRFLPTLQRLRYLEVSNSKLKSVPTSICNLRRLIRLNLQGNTIYSWRNENCGKVMGNLKEFSLANNNIRKINKTSFSEALLNNSQLMWNLSFNNYFCSCNLLWFRDWLKRNAERIVNYPKCYRCKLLSGVKIKISSYVIDEYCKNRGRPSILLLLGICLGSLSLVIIICSVVAYVKRWSVRYWCYLLYARNRKYKSLVDNIEYIYDAFICYNSSDIHWILNKLIPKIEEAEGFQLCLHDRDFKAGLAVVDNIVESVQTSRKVVLILSPEFASSNWCKYEASLAEQRLLEENRDMVIPILLEEIPDHIQSRRLATLLKRKTYLEWTTDERGEEVFWKRFSDCLAAPSSYTEV